MTRRSLLGPPILLLSVAALAAGCGSGGAKQSEQPTTAHATTAPSTASSTSQGSGALTAEAQQTAAGDVPDNQVFLTFRNGVEGYSMKYPEGWAQRGSAARVSFQDKNNLVRIDVLNGSSVTTASATAELNALKKQTPTLAFDAPTQVTVSGKQLVKVVYSTENAPNPVTGKRVTLVVDRYYVPGSGKHAVVDLGTPKGVDNVDAYRMMIESFKWS